LAGADSIDIDVEEPPTVGRLRAALAARLPPLANLLRHALFAVNAEYVSSETLLAPTDEVACIPPVSGG
jgi:molybdopterin synthase catalytic subunit/molybdopterin synthase sulfur carrier subunit